MVGCSFHKFKKMGVGRMKRIFVFLGLLSSFLSASFAAKGASEDHYVAPSTARMADQYEAEDIAALKDTQTPLPGIDYKMPAPTPRKNIAQPTQIFKPSQKQNLVQHKKASHNSHLKIAKYSKKKLIAKRKVLALHKRLPASTAGNTSKSD